MKPRLFHASDEAGISLFEPRPSPAPDDTGISGRCVWAVDEAHLRNYLFPRECPRICFAAGPRTAADDVARLLHGASAVVAVETGWFERLCSATLHLYEFEPTPFRCTDSGAGYWISTDPVSPVSVTTVTDIPGALLARGVDLRLLEEFWPLRDAVVSSTLEFSVIRQRNARPRR